jgi:hypothetical protein
VDKVGIGTLIVVVVGLPIWLAIAAAIKLGSRGPVFYADRRVGLGEREFPSSFGSTSTTPRLVDLGRHHDPRQDPLAVLTRKGAY